MNSTKTNFGIAREIAAQLAADDKSTKSNPITKLVKDVHYNQTCPALPAVSSADFGCIKNDEEFAQRAADLLAGMEAHTFELLAQALANVCSEISKENEDPCYPAAQALFAQAAQALHARKSC